MRVPRCVKIPRRRNNIGRARCFAIRSLSFSPPVRGRIVVSVFFFFSIYLCYFPLFAIGAFIGGAARTPECFFARDARDRIRIEIGM